MRKTTLGHGMLNAVLVSPMTCLTVSLGMTSAVISTMSFTILNTNPAEELKKE